MDVLDMVRPIRSRQHQDRNSDLPVPSQGGFSLIEVLIAMSILTIGILAIVQMEIIAQRNITSGNIVTTATLLAQSELEKIKNHINIIDLQNSFNVDPNPHDPFHITYAFSDPISQALEQSSLPNCETTSHDGSGSCLAVVTVSWKRGGGGRGGSGHVQFKTMVLGVST